MLMAIRYDGKPFEINRSPVKVELPDVAGNYEMITELYGRKNKVVRSYRQVRMVQYNFPHTLLKLNSQFKCDCCENVTRIGPI